MSCLNAGQLPPNARTLAERIGDVTFAVGHRIVVAAVVGMALPIATSVTALAQTNERTYESLEYRVITPGARAVAMGSTFVGLADDATAAASNPAGLSNLINPEMSVEWTGARMYQQRLVETIPSVASQTSHQNAAFPSFGSFVYPFPDKDVLRRFTLAAFYSSAQRFKDQFMISNFCTPGTPIGNTVCPPSGTQAGGGYFGRIDITATTFGGGGAALLTPWLSVGGTLTAMHLGMGIDSNTSESPTPDQFQFRSGSTVEYSGTRPSGQIGILVKPFRAISIGGVYNAGATFNTSTTVNGTFSVANGVTLPAACASPPGNCIGYSLATQYTIPDRWSIGAAIRPGASWTFLMDGVYVKYSQLVTSQFKIIDWMFQNQLDSSFYHIPNVIELHAGGEFRFGRRRIVSIRMGAFTDPDHQMRFDYQTAYNKTDAANHYNTDLILLNQQTEFDSTSPRTVIGASGGAGILLRNSWQLDGAISVSANAHQVVLSFVKRFGQ